MGRSSTRPQTGSIVWYFAAAPPAALPRPALVVGSVSKTNFDLCVFNADGATVTAALNTPFHYGTRPTSGAWCTMVRVNEPAGPTVWPSGEGIG